MSNIDPQEFGRLQAQVDHLEKLVTELRGDVRELLAVMENARGGWKTLILIGGAAGALGAMLTKLLPYVVGR